MTPGQTIAIADLRRTSDAMLWATSSIATATRNRDAAIRRALDADVPVAAVCEATALTKWRIYQIRNNK